MSVYLHHKCAFSKVSPKKCVFLLPSDFPQKCHLKSVYFCSQTLYFGSDLDLDLDLSFTKIEIFLQKINQIL